MIFLNKMKLKILLQERENKTNGRNPVKYTVSKKIRWHISINIIYEKKIVIWFILIDYYYNDNDKIFQTNASIDKWKR